MTGVLIDASNLRGGGGVQVAASFIEELETLTSAQTTDFPWLAQTTVLVNPTVALAAGEALSRLPNVRIEEPRPWSPSRWHQVGRGQHRFDVSFVVFGPEYAARRAIRRVVGYADVRSVCGNPAGESLGSRQRIRWQLRGLLSRGLMRRADVLIVETEAFREAVVRRGVAQPEDVRVVPNTLHAVFNDPSRWTDLRVDRPPGTDLLLGYVARPYPHKNHAFLPQLRQAALGHGVSLRFVVTFSPEAWERCDEDFRGACVNVGEVPLHSLPALYGQVDGVVFPSLLEAFSVTPLEAMRMERPLLVSDRDFLRSVCGDAALYFDPLDVDSATAGIVDSFSDRVALEERVARGRRLVDNWPTALDRTRAYLQVIDEQLALVSR